MNRMTHGDTHLKEARRGIIVKKLEEVITGRGTPLFSISSECIELLEKRKLKRLIKRILDEFKVTGSENACHLKLSKQQLWISFIIASKFEDLDSADTLIIRIEKSFT